MDKISKQTQRIDAVIGRFKTEAARLREEADKKDRMAQMWERVKRHKIRREELVAA